MEILILIAILAVGASALYVAFRFDARVGKVLAPLRKNIASDTSRQIEANNKVLAEQQKAAAGAAIAGVRAELDDIKRSIATVNIAVKKVPLRDDLEKLSHQLGQLDRALARQHEMISMISKHTGDRYWNEGGPVGAELETAMLEAEAYVARQGWGQPPQLFSLASKASVVAADQELADQLRDAEPGALIPLLLQDELPPGQPLDVLATIHWPADVLGCVLITEVVTLPPEAEKDAPDDPDTARQWAAAQPAGREARLAVCVSRDGGYTCGLRMKDDDDVQVSPELADDLVAALLTTF